MRTDSCLCCDISFECQIDNETDMLHCHCWMCRKHHGSPFATFMPVKESQFRWTAGEVHLARNQASPRSAFQRASCWADAEPALVAPLVARECGVEQGSIDGFVGPGMHNGLLPRVTSSMTESLQRTIDQTHEPGFSEQRFSADDWVDQRTLLAAYEYEGVTG